MRDIFRALISDYVYINNHMLIACGAKLMNKNKAVVRMKTVGLKGILATELRRKI
jgi:hypothetical protein